MNQNIRNSRGILAPISRAFLINVSSSVASRIALKVSCLKVIMSNFSVYLSHCEYLVRIVDMRSPTVILFESASFWSNSSSPLDNLIVLNTVFLFSLTICSQELVTSKKSFKLYRRKLMVMAAVRTVKGYRQMVMKDKLRSL